MGQLEESQKNLWRELQLEAMKADITGEWFGKDVLMPS